ncbi:hypothetical protein BH18VER1_BH18VER1_05540 [soil metagenome]
MIDFPQMLGGLSRQLSPRSLGPAQYIFAAVFFLRLVALVQLTGSPSFLPGGGDARFYDQWAQQIAGGKWTDHHAFYGLPLYAYALASIYKVFGYGPFFPTLLQAAADAGTATVLFKLAGRVFDGDQRRAYAVGTAAAAVWAFFVPAQAYAITLMPTVWAVFAFWVLVWFVVRNDEAPRPGAALVSGLVIGVVAMGVATILFLVPLLIAALFVKPAHAAQPVAGRMRMTALAWLLAGIVAGTSPCLLHNLFVAHDRVFLSAHSGVNFWIGNNPEATGYPHFTEGLRAGQATMLKDSIAVAERAAGRQLKRSEVSRYWSRKARDHIRREPSQWLRLMWRKMVNFWSAFQYDDLSIISRLREEGILRPGFAFGGIAALALPGICFAVARHRRTRWILLAVILQMAAVLPVFVTERYRTAAAPGLVLFASYGLWSLWKSCATRRFVPASAHVCLTLIGALAVSAAPAEPSLWALDLYSAGLRAAERGDSREAEQKYSRALAYAPGNPEATFALGNVYYERGELDTAREYYRKVLDAEPHHRGALNNLGMIELTKEHPAESERYFRQALEQEPEDATLRYLLAKSLLARGDRKAAEAEVDYAIRLKPDQPEFHALRDQIHATDLYN